MSTAAAVLGTILILAGLVLLSPPLAMVGAGALLLGVAVAHEVGRSR